LDIQFLSFHKPFYRTKLTSPDAKPHRLILQVVRLRGTILFMKFLAAILITIMSWAVSAESAPPLDLLSGRYSKVVWKSNLGGKTTPRPNISDGRRGLRLKCPFKKRIDRCYWDAAIAHDFSNMSRISMSIDVSDTAAASGGTLYLHSGSGWYSCWFSLKGGGRRLIKLERSDFKKEGHPAGRDKIDKIRIAVWKAADRNAVVSITDLMVFSGDIVVIYNSYAAKTHPEETSAIEHAVEDIERWFESGGVSIGRLSDKDIASGFPHGCKLAVLPYNPYSPPATLAAIRKFTSRGGRIIAAYSLPPELAAVLGLKSATWMRSGEDAKFASIYFSVPLSIDINAGFPLRMRQNSWNARIPKVKTAEVLGYWKDGSGRKSRLPAITKNSNGIFIGHLLLDGDSENKIRFLMAAALSLCPDLKDQIITARQKKAERLFSFPDWESTRNFIESESESKGKGRANRILKVKSDLVMVDICRGVTSRTPKTALTSELSSHAVITRIAVQQAYFHAVANRGVPNEFRGIWCHDAAGVAGMNWNEIAKIVKDNGFNALFANMLWPGCAYYPSSIVPGPPPTNPRQGDLLKKCLKACRKNGLELHLWKVCWNLSQASPAYIAKMKAAGRLQKKADGSTVNWLCPSDPRNRKLELNAVVEAARNYKISGIHYDYIRYPNSESCYCDGCRRRFETAAKIKIKNWPKDVISGRYKNSFQKWRQDRITLFVAESSRAIKAVRKDLKFSVAVYGSWPSCRDSIGQDWVGWSKYVDFICPMNYVTDDAEAPKLLLKQLIAIRGKAPIYPGLGPSAKDLPPEQVVHQVDLIRKAGAKGFILFDLDKDLLYKHLPALRSGATAE